MMLLYTASTKMYDYVCKHTKKAREHKTGALWEDTKARHITAKGRIDYLQ